MLLLQQVRMESQKGTYRTDRMMQAMSFYTFFFTPVRTSREDKSLFKFDEHLESGLSLTFQIFKMHGQCASKTFKSAVY